MELQTFIDAVEKQKNNLRQMLNKNIALVTHANCLDGAGCKIVMNHFFGDKYDEYFAGYHNIDDMIINLKEKYSTIIVADISPSVEFVIATGNIILIDHHDTAEKYANNKTKFFNNARSGAYLLNEFCKILFERESGIQDFINIIDDYDRYTLKDERSKSLARLFIESNRSWFFEEFSNPIGKFEVKELYEKIINRNILKFKDSVEDAVLFEPDNSKSVAYIIMNKQYVNEASEFMLKKYKCICAFLPVGDKDYYSISVRQQSESKLHIGKILEHFFKDAGGHPDAAGVRIKATNESLVNFIKTMQQVYSSTNIPQNFYK